MEAGVGSLIPKRHSLDRTARSPQGLMYWQQMGKLSDLRAGISMVAPLSSGLSDEKKKKLQWGYVTGVCFAKPPV